MEFALFNGIDHFFSEHQVFTLALGIITPCFPVSR